MKLILPILALCVSMTSDGFVRPKSFERARPVRPKLTPTRQRPDLAVRPGYRRVRPKRPNIRRLIRRIRPPAKRAARRGRNRGDFIGARSRRSRNLELLKRRGSVADRMRRASRRFRSQVTRRAKLIRRRPAIVLK